MQLNFADSRHRGPRVAAARSVRVEIIRRSEGQVGFAACARRWLVERFFAWINRNRRLAKDVVATFASAEAFLYAAFAILLFRRLAQRLTNPAQTLRSSSFQSNRPLSKDALSISITNVTNSKSTSKPILKRGNSPCFVQQMMSCESTLSYY